MYDTRCPQCGASRTVVNTTSVSPTNTQPLAPLVSSVSAGIQRLTAQNCVHCGTANSLFVLRCQGCGNVLASVRTPTTPRQRGVAAALAFFGGFIGAQYFYMGRRVLGGACVALCWTGYPAIVGFLETFRLLLLSDAEFQQQCEG